MLKVIMIMHTESEGPGTIEDFKGFTQIFSPWLNYRIADIIKYINASLMEKSI